MDPTPHFQNGPKIFELAVDLNKIGMAKSKFFEKYFYSILVFRNKDPTHRLGGHYDDVWTNLAPTDAIIVLDLITSLTTVLSCANFVSLKKLEEQSPESHIHNTQKQK